MSWKKADLAYLEKVLDSLGILSDIQTLPQSLKTKITPNKSFLSQGQSCCLIIARAIIAGSRLIIIDQLLDYLDYELRSRVLQYLRQLVKNGEFTLILSGYNRNVLENCDVAYEIKDKKFLKIDLRGK